MAQSTEKISSGPSQRQIKVSFWLINNKLNLLKWLKYLLFGINIIIWLFVVISLSLYFIQYSKYQQLYTELRSQQVNTFDYHQKNSIKPIIIDLVGYIESDQKDMYDLYAKISNQNASWSIENFDYQFISNNQKFGAKTDFLSNMNSKYILQLSVYSKSKPDNLKIEISNINWKKKTQKQIEQAKSLSKLEVADVKFISSYETGVSQKIPLARLSFKLKNNSGYGYWEVKLPIVLFYDNQIRYVNLYKVENIKPFTTNSVEINFSSGLNSLSSYDIKPDLNFFDQSILKPIESDRPQSNIDDEQ